jgi:glycine/D-amino acid oxidase-like deaminating enzyme
MRAGPRMRVIVVGAGLAGALLAWRLQAAGAAVVLIGLRTATRDDATAASGGIVRAFEPDPRLAALAAAGLAELRADPVLREWAGYREVGSLYLTTGPVPAPPTGAALLPAADVHRRFGLAGLPDAVTGVYEPHGGHIVPHRLRAALLDRLVSTVDARVTVVKGTAVRLHTGDERAADAVVLATGPWTPALLHPRSSTTTAHPALTTKHIQYGVHEVEGPPLPSFMDETTGLYGRPAGPGRMLLGVPATRYGVDPERPVADASLTEQVRDAARHRLPGHRIGPALRTVVACDCYCEPAGLALRRVAGALFTFTGGSGGAAKTALAASRAAATQLTATQLTATQLTATELTELAFPVGGR